MSEPTNTDTPTVLVVENDRDLADTYSTWLEPDYEVRTAHSGSDGLTWYDPVVDIVLIDGRIPDGSGSSLARQMDQREVDDRKALLTSTEPGCELADLPCDEYLTKPVTKTQLRDTVRELRLRSKLDDDLKRHFALTSKITALENRDTTETDPAIADLRRDAERARTRIEDRIEGIGEFEAAFRAVE